LTTLLLLLTIVMVLRVPVAVECHIIMVGMIVLNQFLFVRNQVMMKMLKLLLLVPHHIINCGEEIAREIVGLVG